METAVLVGAKVVEAKANEKYLENITPTEEGIKYLVKKCYPERKRRFDIFDENMEKQYTIHVSYNKKELELVDLQENIIGSVIREYKDSAGYVTYAIKLNRKSGHMKQEIKPFKALYTYKKWKIERKLNMSVIMTRPDGKEIVSCLELAPTGDKHYSTYYTFDFPDNQEILLPILLSMAVTDCNGRD